MNKPNFFAGAYDVSPEHPSDWSVVPVLGMSEKSSLSGKLLRDVAWRKYQYILTWDAMSKDDFDDLEELFNYSYDSGTEITFTYGKWSWSSSGVQVLGTISDRVRTAGSGADVYYSKVTITLTEVEKRT